MVTLSPPTSEVNFGLSSDIQIILQIGYLRVGSRAQGLDDFFAEV